jgi:hypothetical protein
MRHFLANIMTYAIAAALILGAAAFAWMRNAQLALVTETDVIARFAPAPAGEFRWHELGGISYQRNCANCHGTSMARAGTSTPPSSRPPHSWPRPAAANTSWTCTSTA